MCNINNIIKENTELITLLEIINSLKLKDCWLCAGTIRNYIWDYLSNKNSFTSINLSDIDVIFFDENISYEQTIAIEDKIKKQYPQYNWEIKNQYYMNIHSPNTEKYTSSKDAVSKFPEKCTAIAARLDNNQDLELFTPYGIEDLINFKISPTPHYSSDKKRQIVYNERIKKKKWINVWPNLSIELL
ncbi:nucleotidyltransferase family protein [Streptococcus devriesei]|uniref:nucleotidyltransferase family protein n=1 Tax=Streptococcus devriesei TaxID=231233 RepID=UPI00040ADD28|nr:nucleotidyltransferase family protein [Streptococcus devriesei]